jgi:hypothetical protein
MSGFGVAYPDMHKTPRVRKALNRTAPYPGCHAFGANGQSTTSTLTSTGVGSVGACVCCGSFG